MQEITYEDFIGRLLETVHEFHPDEDDVADQRGTLVLEDLARFVRSKVESDDTEELIARIFGFIEEAAKSSDVRVLDAIRYSFLESVADSPYHLKLTKKHMGHLTLKLLKDAQHFLYP